MNTRDINKLVAPAYSALHVLNNIKWTAYRDELCAKACEEERQHRRGKPADVRLPKGASIEAAGRLFAVKRIAQLLNGEKPPRIRDLLSYQPSAVYAAAIVANYRKEIRKAWKGQDIAALAALDYVQFINNGEAP